MSQPGSINRANRAIPCVIPALLRSAIGVFGQFASARNFAGVGFLNDDGAGRWHAFRNSAAASSRSAMYDFFVNRQDDGSRPVALQ